ncbi:endonuclease domain-containing protein [Kocuria sediminis]
MTYKMSPEQYDALMSAQGGRCGSCFRTREETGDAREMCVDHDHTCCPKTPTCGNCNRGLLCRECNTGLGMFRDDPWRLMCGIIYLLKYRKKGPYGDAQATPENL